MELLQYEKLTQGNLSNCKRRGALAVSTFSCSEGKMKTVISSINNKCC